MYLPYRHDGTQQLIKMCVGGDVKYDCGQNHNLSLVLQKVHKNKQKLQPEFVLGSIFSNLEVEITPNNRVHLQGLALGQVPLH